MGTPQIHSYEENVCGCYKYVTTWFSFCVFVLFKLDVVFRITSYIQAFLFQLFTLEVNVTHQLLCINMIRLLYCQKTICDLKAGFLH